MSSVHLEAGFLMAIVGEDFLQRQDTSDGEGNLGDDQSLTGDSSQHLQTDGPSNTHGSQDGGDDVTVVLVALVSTGSRSGRLLHIDAQRVGLEELVQLGQDRDIEFSETEAAQGAGVGQQRDARVFGSLLLNQCHSVQQWDRFLGEDVERWIGFEMKSYVYVLKDVISNVKFNIWVIPFLLVHSSINIKK